MSTSCGVNARLASCLNSVLNVKALVGAFNQEKALVGAFSVIVQPVVAPMDRFAALVMMDPGMWRQAPGHQHPATGHPTSQQPQLSRVFLAPTHCTFIVFCPSIIHIDRRPPDGVISLNTIV